MFCSTRCQSTFLYSEEPLPGACASCANWRTYAAVVETGWCERLTAVDAAGRAALVGCSLWQPRTKDD